MSPFKVCLLTLLFLASCNKKGTSETETTGRNTPPEETIVPSTGTSALGGRLYSNLEESQKIELVDSLRFSNTLLFENIECSQAILPKSDIKKPIGHVENPFNLAVSAMEFGEYSLGGIGAVVNSSVPKIAQHSRAAGLSTNIFLVVPFYQNGRKWKESAKQVCTIEHIFNFERVKSQIYLSEYTFNSKPTKEKVSVLFVKPDSKFADLFDITGPMGIYGTTARSDLFNRGAYIGSATGALMQGLHSQGSRFHVLHSHSFMASIGNTLLNEIPAAERPQTVMHVHNLNSDQGNAYPFLTCEGFAPCNLMAYCMLNSDFVATVSETMIKEGKSEDDGLSFGLDKTYRRLFSEFPEKNRIRGVPNGIDHQSWDPFLDETLNIVDEGVNLNFKLDPSNVFQSKKTIKEYLAKKNYISDPNKPLFLFIGRYSREKGTDMLSKAVLSVKENGGAFIIMGAGAYKNIGRRYVDEIRAHYWEEPDIHVMKGDVAKEQMGPGKPGLLIRAAADFVLVPSHEEAFGLVPIESFAMGALAITSGVSGMKDYLVDFSMKKLSGNSFNYEEYAGFNADYDTKIAREEVMEEAIRNAFRYFWGTNDAQKSEVSKRLNREAKKFDWLAKGGSADKHFDVYRTVLSRAGKTLQ